MNKEEYPQESTADYDDEDKSSLFTPSDFGTSGTCSCSTTPTTTIGCDGQHDFNELKLKIGALEAKVKVLEVTNKHLEEKLGQEQKYAKLEAKMRDKSVERKLLESQQKMEEFAKELKDLKEQQQKPENNEEDQIRLNFLWNRLSEVLKYINCKIKLTTNFKEKRLETLYGNHWNRSNPKVTISTDGLHASIAAEGAYVNGTNIYAKEGFPISGPDCRKDHFPGTIVYYFEITQTASNANGRLFVGLSDGCIPDGKCVGNLPNTYAIQPGFDWCRLSGKCHRFECPPEMGKPVWNGGGDVVGCGLFLDPKNKLSIFFTGNGMLMGTKIAIKHTGDRLYPTVTMLDRVSVEANFGHDAAKPFKFIIDKIIGKEYKFVNPPDFCSLL